MANSQVTVRDTQLEKQRTGYINLNLTELTTNTEPDIAAGSVVEVGGSLYSFTADETPSGWAGIANDTQAYIKLAPGASDVTSSFVTTAPTYSSAKGGWYSGDDRYVARVYKDSSGNAIEKEVYSQESEATADLIMRSLPWFTNRTVYSTSGSDTWTCPDDVYFVKVCVIGAGGGGGGAGINPDNQETVALAGGGGSGAVIFAHKRVEPGRSYSLTVGAGGAGGSAGPGGVSSHGQDGGDSIFDTWTAGGGSGANSVTATQWQTLTTTGGSGAADPAIQYSMPGNDGEDGGGDSGGDGGNRQNGESTFWQPWPLKYDDTATEGSGATDGSGTNGTGYGAGGGGGGHSGTSNQTQTGGDGADGVVIIAY